VLVLLAALQATAGERRFDSAVLRTLGTSRAVAGGGDGGIRCLGTLAATLAVAAAALIGMAVARAVRHRIAAAMVALLPAARRACC
jgi:putative ABC transport system permease protein